MFIVSSISVLTTPVTCLLVIFLRTEQDDVPSEISSWPMVNTVYVKLFLYSANK